MSENLRAEPARGALGVSKLIHARRGCCERPGRKPRRDRPIAQCEQQREAMQATAMDAPEGSVNAVDPGNGS
jgi:hypothetical protein